MKPKYSVGLPNSSNENYSFKSYSGSKKNDIMRCKRYYFIIFQ
jgi:hypothetical protein